MELLLERGANPVPLFFLSYTCTFSERAANKDMTEYLSGRKVESIKRGSLQRPKGEFLLERAELLGCGRVVDYLTTEMQSVYW
jgi:hypothetical protein